MNECQAAFLIIYIHIYIVIHRYRYRYKYIHIYIFIDVDVDVDIDIDINIYIYIYIYIDIDIDIDIDVYSELKKYSHLFSTKLPLDTSRPCLYPLKRNRTRNCRTGILLRIVIKLCMTKRLCKTCNSAVSNCTMTTCCIL